MGMDAHQTRSNRRIVDGVFTGLDPLIAVPRVAAVGQ